MTQRVGEAIQKWFHLLRVLCTHFYFNLDFAPLYPTGLWYYNEQQKQHFQQHYRLSVRLIYSYITRTKTINSNIFLTRFVKTWVFNDLFLHPVIYDRLQQPYIEKNLLLHSSSTFSKRRRGQSVAKWQNVTWRKRVQKMPFYAGHTFWMALKGCLRKWFMGCPFKF